MTMREAFRQTVALLSLLSILAFAGCRVSAPENGSDAITLMTKYNEQGRQDDAISVAQDWLRKHPNDPSHGARFYEQIALIYLTKASKDSAHREEWVRQAVTYYDRDLSVHQREDLDLELYLVGRGFEAAGDLSSQNSCLYYERAVKDFEDEVPFIQGESYTAYGKTTQLAPVRQENEKALERVKAKFARAN